MKLLGFVEFFDNCVKYYDCEDFFFFIIGELKVKECFFFFLFDKKF